MPISCPLRDVKYTRTSVYIRPYGVQRAGRVLFTQESHFPCRALPGFCGRFLTHRMKRAGIIIDAAAAYTRHECKRAPRTRSTRKAWITRGAFFFFYCLFRGTSKKRLAKKLFDTECPSSRAFVFFMEQPLIKIRGRSFLSKNVKKKESCSNFFNL